MCRFAPPILAVLLAAASLTPATRAGDCQGGTPIASLPFLIDAPGLYALTRNLSGSAGITVTASDVTLDLQGFRLRGDGNLPAIATSGPVENLVIRDGTLRRWSTAVQAGSATGVRIEDVRAVEIFGFGLICGPQADVRDCLLLGTAVGAETGVVTGPDSRVESCLAAGLFVGFDVGDDSLVQACLASQMQSDGFQLGRDAVLTECVSVENNGDGVQGDGGAVITRSVFAGNQGSGVNAVGECVVREIVATSNQASGVDFLGGAGGFGRGQLSSSMIASNAGSGVVALTATTVAGSVVHGNADGIRALEHTTLRDNLVISNSGSAAGIVLIQTDSLVQDNHIVGNGFGLQALGGYNEIIRNSCQGNLTNYDIAVLNVAGPQSSNGALAGPFDNVDF